MTIGAEGQIKWNATAGHLAGSPHTVTVTVSDDQGLSDTDEFLVTVQQDMTDPTVSIVVPEGGANIGDEVVVRVHAIDDLDIVGRTLTLVSVTDGGVTTLDLALPLDADGQTRLTLLPAYKGVLTFSATAENAGGRVGTADPATLDVFDPAAAGDPPTAEILSPSASRRITAPVDVIGTVADDVGIHSWTLTAVPLDGSETDPKVIASGGAAVDNGVLGRFDPTLLRNGLYRLELAVTDTGGLPAFDEVTVEVAGNLKLGNFTLSFVDLEVPVAGIPITVTRTYDTLDADVQGDFGYGWSLDLSTTKVQVEFGGDPVDIGSVGNQPITDGTRVLVTLPDGTQEGFTFAPVPTSSGVVDARTHYPRFVPDFGVNSELLVPQHLLYAWGDGTYLDLDTGDIVDGLDYSPFNPRINTAFTLKLRNGTELVINAQTGELYQVVDTLGNTLTFTGLGIEHSAGRSVQFERDSWDHITAIIDPAGRRIEYSYDLFTGDLVSVTDRVQATTEFRYLDGPNTPEHYLEKIINALGQQAARTEYDEQGRVKRVIDAAGKEIVYEWNGESRVQRITDQLGHTTVIESDERGNVVREEDPEGGITVRAWDADDNLLSETIVVGLKDSPANGETDDLITTHTYSANGDRETTTDPRGNVTRTTHNAFGQPTSVTTNGVSTINQYDGQGLLRSSEDPSNNVTSFEYDDGNVTSVRDEDEQTWMPDGSVMVTNTYNQYGDPTSTSPAAGRQTYFDYHLNGDRVATWYFEGTGAEQIQVLDLKHYDEAGQVSGTTRAVLPAGEFITQDLATAPIPPQHIQWTTTTTNNLTGQVETETDQFGRVTEHRFNLLGQEIEVRTQSADEVGNTAWLVTRTVYDSAGRAVVTTDQYVEGTSEPITGTRTHYDAAGRVIKTERLKGVIIGLVGSGALVQSVLTTAGTVVSSTRSEYDNADRTTVSTDDFGLETRFTYNRFGETVETRTESINETGQTVWLVTRTVYDGQGRKEVSTDPYLEGSTDPVYATRTVYDELGREFLTIGLEGVQVELVNGETTLVDAGAELWRSETIYNEQGRVDRTIDQSGQITDFEYDELGRRSAVVGHPLPAEEVGVTGYDPGTLARLRNETVYNDQGRIETERTNVRQIVLPDGTVQIDSAAAQETSYEYDDFGNVVKTTFADGTFITAIYDEFDRKTSETNQMGLTRTLEYDDQGRLVKVLLPDLNPDPQVELRPTYEYGYNALGQQTLVRDPLNRETRLAFDDQGRQLSRRLPLGFGPDGIQGTGDDSTLPEGDFTESFEYDDRGRETLHVTFEWVYVQSVYDAQTGRLSARRFFDNETAWNGGAGTPNEVWSYTYDAFGRQVEVVQDDGSTVRATSTGYDARGRVVSIDSPEGRMRYEHDALGRKTRAYTVDPADPQNVTNDFRYTYDALSRLQSVEVWERNDALVDADPASGQQPETTRYAYDLVGNLDRTDLPNGVITDYVYDELNRLDVLTHYAPDGTPETLADNDRLAEFDYTLRNDGRRESVVETFWWDDGTDGILDSHQNTLTWSYDELGRLTDEVFASYDDLLEYSDHFTYDLTGNRLEKTRNWVDVSKPDETVTYQYDANDRLVSEELDTTGDGQPESVTTYGYAGTQQASKEVNVGGVLARRETFGYDLQGRMAVVTIETHQGGSLDRVERTTYEYDASGIRVSALHEVDADADTVFESATRTEYLNDPQNFTGYAQVLQETEIEPSTGEILKRTVYTIGHDAISQTVTEYTGGVPGVPTTSFLGYDGHGSTRVLFDMAAAIATIAAVREVFHYDAHGNLLNMTAAQAATRLLYSGEMFDARIGQQYLRTRWYDAAAGRFNRLDPFFGNLQDPQSLHKYLYVHGDPINAVDPTGQFASLALAALGGIFGRYFAAATRAQLILNVGSALVSIVNLGLWGLRTYFDNINNEGPVAGKAPDALLFSISVAAAVALNFVPGPGPFPNAGFGPVVNFDWLILRKNPQWTYFYIAPGANLGTANISTSVELGAVWDVDKATDYTGQFMITSVAFLPGFLKLPGFLPGFSGLSGTVFYDPTDWFDGSYGASFGPAFGSRGLGYYTAWTFYHLVAQVPTWAFLQQFLQAAGIAQFQRLLQQPNMQDLNAFAHQHADDIVAGLLQG